MYFQTDKKMRTSWLNFKERFIASCFSFPPPPPSHTHASYSHPGGLEFVYFPINPLQRSHLLFCKICALWLWSISLLILSTSFENLFRTKVHEFRFRWLQLSWSISLLLLKEFIFSHNIEANKSCEFLLIGKIFLPFSLTHTCSERNSNFRR